MLIEGSSQREDRDSYISFDCTGLSQYAAANAAVQAARNQGSPDSMSSACKFSEIGQKYGLGIISSYNKINPTVVVNNVAFQVRRSHGTAYDYNSIMHYQSDSDAAYYNRNDLANAHVPIRRWINGGPSFTPPQQATAQNSVLMPLNEVPSNLDILWVKTVYHW